MGPKSDRTSVRLRRERVQSSEDSHTEEKPHEDMERRWSSASQKERPQQKRIRMATSLRTFCLQDPWGNISAVHATRFVTVCYGSPSNKPHFINQGSGAHISSQTEPVFLHTQLCGLHATNKSTFLPPGSSKHLPEMPKCSPYRFSQLFSNFWNQVSKNCFEILQIFYLNFKTVWQ